MEYDHAYFSGKVAAVTGAASGIGLALCEELLESGADKVVMADFNKDNLAAHEARLAEKYPGKVKGVLCNVTVEDEVRSMVAQAAEFGGRLDLLINCAGAALRGKFIDGPATAADDVFGKTLTNETWKKGFALNFFGPLYGCRAAIPLMVEQGSGQIVNIISGIAFSPMAYQSAYAATKAALCNLSFCLRAEYGGDGVKVSAATPGTTATAIFTGDAPPEAQSPRQSAQRILAGVVANQRIILGDDSDVSGAKTAFFPDIAGKMLDEIFLGFARQRRNGVLSFVSDEESAKNIQGDEAQKAALIDIMAEIDHIAESPERTGEAVRKIEDYIRKRDSTTFDHDYYKGKTAAVTGGASGVGLAMCELLLECGADKVALADFNRDNLAKHEARLNEKYPGRVKGLFCDVSDEESVKSMVAQANAFFGGRFDLLVNCAGIGQMGMFARTKYSDEISERSKMRVESNERWERVFAVNFYGPLYGCRAALPLMMAQGGGQIINIISGTAFVSMPYQCIYAASKAALNMLTLTLRYEYGDDNIMFNSATPGTTATAIFSSTGAPAEAQLPSASALRILAGAARNDRLICGDFDDLKATFVCFLPEAGVVLDPLLTTAANSRRGGRLSSYGR